MYLQNLVYFVKVAELHHFTKAADSLFITQSALSKSIRNLEQELGAPLFAKDGRHVLLTDYGNVFYRYAKSTLSEYEKGVAAVKALAQQANNTVSVSALFGMHIRYLPTLIQDFRRKNSSCTFQLNYAMTNDILSDIMENRADIGICCDFPLEDFPELKHHPIGREELVLVVPPNHRLAKREPLSWADLQGEDFILFKQAYGVNYTIKEKLQREGIDFNIVKEIDDGYSLMGLVSAGVGIAVLTMEVIDSNNVVPLRFRPEEALFRTILVIWKQESQPSFFTEAFRKHIIQNPMSSVSPSVRQGRFI